MNKSRYLVAQLGARMHYAVPRILHAADRLERLCTDFVANRGWPRLLHCWPRACRPAALQRLLGRVPAGVPVGHITAYPSLGLRYAYRLRNSRTPSDSTAAFLWSGREFCRRVVSEGFGTATGVYTFNSAGLEILQAARAAGLRAVMEQTIAPKQIEQQLLAAVAATFSDWEPVLGNDSAAAEYAAREFEEWQAADTILCGSEFVRDGIARCGGPAEKCVVVPYGVDVGEPSQKSEIGNAGSAKLASFQLSAFPISALARTPPSSDLRPLSSDLRPPSSAPRPLRVLTVGAVGLRKGSPYVLAAAQRVRGAAEFRMVGPVNVSAAAQSHLREALHLMGPVPRSAIGEQFAWADVFLLPSVCEGSATVTYEAMAHGVPVICTPNTGSVVRDGIEGFIVPVGNVDAIVDRLEHLRANAEGRTQMSMAARSRAAEFTVAAYGQRLLAAL